MLAHKASANTAAWDTVDNLLDERLNNCIEIINICACAS